jgi:hypothetical protein
MADPQTWFNEMPKLTKFLFAGTAGLTLLAHFGQSPTLHLFFSFFLVCII